MNGYKLFTHVTAVGMLVGAVTAPVVKPAHVQVTLLSVDSPLSCSEMAITVEGTVEPTPAADFARAAEDLYLHALVSTAEKPTR